MNDQEVKDTLHDFAQRAKRVVTDTVHAQTLAYEQEAKLLAGMKTKNENMLNALAAIDSNTKKFKQEKAEIDTRLKEAKKHYDW